MKTKKERIKVIDDMFYHCGERLEIRRNANKSRFVRCPKCGAMRFLKTRDWERI